VSVRSPLPVFALGILASALTARPVAAATASASISVNATVQVSCLVSAATSTFRTYAAAAAAASAVSVACSNSAPFTVTLNATSALAATRDLRETTASGFVLLGYALSPNIRGIANWGQALSIRAAAGFGSGSPPQLAALGRLSAGQDATASADTNMMIVVVTY
jgi:spore coat protein U domain-containing protein, fimbrial subunit CupE1/2/3/6